MIEMDEQFQREFGAAMASLRAVHASLVGTAKDSRGEARAIAAAEEGDAAVVAYEASHAYWDAADRVRTVMAAFEDADRRAAQLMAAPAPEEPRELRALRERTRYLEEQLARLDTALRGRPATPDEKIRETETTEDLIDAVIAHIAPGAEMQFDVTTVVKGTLIAGEWVSAAGSRRKIYVGRLFRLDPDGPVVEYVCDCVNGGSGEGYHVVSSKLNPATVRLPSADEILAFSALTEASGLLKLEGEE